MSEKAFETVAESEDGTAVDGVATGSAGSE